MNADVTFSIRQPHRPGNSCHRVLAFETGILCSAYQPLPSACQPYKTTWLCYTATVRPDRLNTTTNARLPVQYFMPPITYPCTKKRRRATRAKCGAIGEQAHAQLSGALDAIHMRVGEREAQFVIADPDFSGGGGVPCILFRNSADL